MGEAIEQWWQRRRRSRGAEVPYPIGTYRAAWAPFPALIRQYHPELNAGITLTQIPPAAEVLLQWQCEAGHIFVATPAEQRARPGRGRRRSSWCPDCLELARGRPLPALRSTAGATTAGGATAGGIPAPRPAAARRSPPRRAALCDRTPDLDPGTAFVSACAPSRASAAEGELQAGIAARLELPLGDTAVRLRRPFFEHLEAWPDILLTDLRVAIEYDTTGRHGLEHVGRREEADRRKDRLLREAGWEVVRVRTGKLPPLGPYDVIATGPGRRAADGVVSALRAIRGDLLVDAYLKC